MFGAALIVGLFGEVFLRIVPSGLNALMGIGVLFAALGLLARWQQIALVGQGRWLVWPALFFAASFAWRDSLTLHWINGLALLVTLVLASRYTRSGQMQYLYISQWAAGLAQSFVQVLEGLFVLVSYDIQWKKFAGGTWADQCQAIKRGLYMALPFVLLFGGFFISADAAFERMALTALRWLLENLCIHLFFIAIFTWIASGWLRNTLFVEEEEARPGERPLSSMPGAIEICVVLGVLNALFFTFVCLQIPYLFGGEERILSTTNLTYAMYARRGFFELVSVAVCVLPLLLFAHWLFPMEHPSQARIFRGLAASLLGLVFVIMWSAAQRMYLYQQVYGLTELRLYSTVFMVWLALVFIWFSATVLRDQRQGFACGVFVSGLASVVLLNILNPDALIARTNVSRSRAPVAFDTGYATSLSADAVPVLLEAWPRLHPAKRRAVARALLSRWTPPAQLDWRTWNWSRARAWQLVTSQQAVLQGVLVHKSSQAQPMRLLGCRIHPQRTLQREPVYRIISPLLFCSMRLEGVC